MLWFKKKNNEALEQLEQLKINKKFLEQEIELSKSKAREDLSAKVREFEHEKKLWEKTKNQDMLILESNLKLSHQQEIAKIKKQSDDEILKIRENLLKDNYEKLQDGLAKLHTEGNITTKFMNDIALKMLEKNQMRLEHKE